MRRLALVGAGLVLVGGLTACGGAPDDASEKDFCDAYGKFQSADEFKDVQKASDKLDEVGTPEKIDGDARDGFELILDTVDDSDDEDALNDNVNDLDSDDNDKLEAFTKKAGEICE
ncbi:hypothetical protein [Nocardioides jensenii]|uniref:hypothetical protein n=1 Tax=Nocardioides jensenii TaxID=1843 RepID=UPI00082EF1B6|nr:hypothetical protein [Nocardioides jensenii]